MQVPSDTHLRRHLLQDGGQPRRPARLLRLCGDQDVAQFDQDVAPLMSDGMARDAVAGQMAAIGLVVAHAEVWLGPQPRNERARKPRVGSIEQPDMPGARWAAAELRREAVDRSEERRVGKERVSTCRSRWSPYH